MLPGLVLAGLLGPMMVARAQDAAPADRNAVHTRLHPGGMSADSPLTFPERGSLPTRFPPDLRPESFDPGEPGFYLFGSPERSLAQIREIQAAMPAGRFTPPPNDWRHLTRTRRVLAEGGTLRIMAIGDSIVNDTMRSGWVALLQAAHPGVEISATVYVRGGGGAQHFLEQDRLRRHVFPRRPDLVLLGGISQHSIEDLAALIDQLRAGLPEVEVLLGTGAFGTVDPRDADALASAPHSGAGTYGHRLRQLAAEKHCAFIDFTTPWAAYLNSSGLHPHRFYRDVGHANEYGEQVLAKILLGFWQPEPQETAGTVEIPHYFTETLTDPRPLRIHGLRVDLRDPGHALDVILAPDPDGDGPAEAALTPPTRLTAETNIVAAINANGFAHIGGIRRGGLNPWRTGDPVRILGWAMNAERTASQPGSSEMGWSFWVTADGQARVSRLEPQGAARLAVAGFAPLIVDGRIDAESGGALHPRTAIGVDSTGHRVVMIVVDGRQPGYSEGMSLAELAHLMHSLGCHEALNLDGGGSSILFHRDASHRLTIRNRPASLLPRPLPLMLVVRTTPAEALPDVSRP
jgi:hypothetical protein